MIKKSGKIQCIFKVAPPTSESAKEKYVVHVFSGLLQMIRKLVTAYKSGCDKVYIFFD